jgi:DNA polymerase
MGYKIPFHVHDEVIIEVLDRWIEAGALNEINRIMAEEISWAKGLPLAADSYASDYYYKKD